MERTDSSICSSSRSISKKPSITTWAAVRQRLRDTSAWQLHKPLRGPWWQWGQNWGRCGYSPCVQLCCWTPLQAHPWLPAGDALLHCEGIQKRLPSGRTKKRKEKKKLYVWSQTSGGQRFPVLPLAHLRDQIRVADNGPHKETVVCNLCAHFHTGCTQVQVHLVVGARDGGQGKIAHAVELQLES